jgi:hypothetical protein
LRVEGKSGKLISKFDPIFLFFCYEWIIIEIWSKMVVVVDTNGVGDRN